MISRISTIIIIGAVAVCLPVATWTFVLQPSRFGSSKIAGQQNYQPQQSQLPLDALQERFSKTKNTQRIAFSLLAKKEEDVDGWEPDEDELMDDDDMDMDELEDELDLDDVASSVAGTNPDEYDDDDIDYEDEEDEEIEEEDDEFDEDEEEFEDEEDEDDEGIEEEGEDVEDGEDSDIDEEDEEDEEEYEEGYSEWWNKYGEHGDESDYMEWGVAAKALTEMGANQEPDEKFWDDDVTMVPLMEDPDDPEYNAKLKKILESSTKRKALANVKPGFDLVKELEEAKDQYQWFRGDDGVTNEDARKLEIMDDVSELLDQAIPSDPNGEEEVTLDKSDLEDIDIREEMMKTTSLFDDEPYIGANRTNIANSGITDEDMEAMDRSWKSINEAMEAKPWNKVIQIGKDFEDYPDKKPGRKYPTQWIIDVYETAEEIGSAGYEVYPWLFYDLGFNVSNLILAAVKHNPDAPIILQHWYPQLCVCERYQFARDRDFDFTWEDVEKANVTELEEYYYGFGYEEIPKKAQAETGMISFEDTDEQETKMAAMEKWMLDIYNSEWDKKDFDDEDMKDEDNVFSENFKMPAHPDLPNWDDVQDDIANWRKEWDEDKDLEDEETREANIAYRNTVGESIDFTNVSDEDFQKNFCGHLIIACGNFDEDLEIAERITERMDKEFGNKIYTETKIYKHAMPEDNLFEIWLESFEIDLLHSKRRASNNIEGWEGKGEITDERMEFLVKEVTDRTGEHARLTTPWTEVGLTT